MIIAAANSFGRGGAARIGPMGGSKLSWHASSAASSRLTSRRGTLTRLQFWTGTCLIDCQACSELLNTFLRIFSNNSMIALNYSDLGFNLIELPEN